MIKQGTVQETLAELNGATSGVLPPLHNLPHWSRVNNLDKARYPKPFLKDRLQPLPNTSEMDVATAITIQANLGSASEEDVQVDVSRGLNPGQRIMHLERSIQFLQQQHHEVLSNLHEEIDTLKRENKDLQFRVVMMQNKSSSPGSAQSSRSGGHRSAHRNDGTGAHKDKKMSGARVPHPPSMPRPGAAGSDEVSPHVDRHSQGSSDEKIEELKIIFLEEEIKELRKALKEEQSRSHYLQKLVETRDRSQAQPKAHSAGPRGPVLQPQPPNLPRGQEGEMDPPGGPVAAYQTPPPPETTATQQLPYDLTFNPLRVTLPTTGGARSPSMKECEVIIKHLSKVNDSQAHELNQLKSDLRDVLYSHKWTPDAFLLAKAYVAEDDAREMAEQSRLPRIELRQTSRKLPDIAYGQKDSVSLPALKQTMGNKAIERRKRHQILQKGRVNKELAN